MKPPKNRRNRRSIKRKASLTPVSGAARRVWLAGFCERLPESAAQLGMTAMEAAQQVAAIRAKFMKTTKQPSTP